MTWQAQLLQRRQFGAVVDGAVAVVVEGERVGVPAEPRALASAGKPPSADEP